MMPALFKAVLPSTTLGRLLLLLNLGFAVALYAWLNELFGHEMGLEFLLVPAAFVYLSAFSLLYLIFRRHPLPLLLLAGGVYIVFSMPRLPSPEERVFVAHRAELEELVELARQRQLAEGTSDGECGRGNEFVVPEAYKHFVADECMLVRGNTELVYVEIRPYWYYDVLIYSDAPLPEHGACGDRMSGEYYRDGPPKQLDEHWFLCPRDSG